MSRHLLTAFGIVLIFVTGGLVTARVLGPRVGLERPWVEGALIGACAVLGIVTANKITRGRRSKPNSRPQ